MNKNFSYGTYELIIVQMYFSLLVSSLIGAAFGFLTSLILKHTPGLNKHSILEQVVIFGMSLISYFLADVTTILWTGMSGDVSQFACGIINANYTWYNLSPQSKSSVHVTFAFLGTLGEALIYSAVGISLYTSIPLYWSFPLILYTFACIVVVRLLMTYFVFTLHYIPCKMCERLGRISFKEMNFIASTGMVRGAIAFALVLKLEQCSSQEE